MFLFLVFPPLFSLRRHIFHAERNCKENCLDIKAHYVLLQLNTSKYLNSSKILKKDFILSQLELDLWAIIALAVQICCTGLRFFFFNFLKPGL